MTTPTERPVPTEDDWERAGVIWRALGSPGPEVWVGILPRGLATGMAYERARIVEALRAKACVYDMGLSWPESVTKGIAKKIEDGTL